MSGERTIAPTGPRVAPLRATRRAAARGARRLFARDAVSLAGRFVGVGAGVGLALLLLDRTIGPAAEVFPAWVMLGAPPAFGLAAALALAWLRRPDAVRSAATIDEALGLHHRLSSALAFEGQRAVRGEDEAFVALALAEAERAAPSARARDAVRIEFGRAWWWAPTLALAGVVGAMFLPRFDLLRPGAAQVAKVERLAQIERLTAAAALEQAQREAEEALKAAAPNLATPEQVESLDEIARQLTKGELDADEARAQAAAGLDQAASRLESQNADAQRQLDALGQRLAGLGQDSGDSTDGAAQAEALEEALRRGDFAAAQESLESIDEALSEDSGAGDAEQSKLREALSRLADAMDASPSTGAAEASESAQRAMENAGLSAEEAARLANQTDERSTREALERKGMSPENAQRLAEQAAEAARRREAAAKAEEDAKSLQESLRQAGKPDAQDGDPKPGRQSDGTKRLSDAKQTLERLANEQRIAQQRKQAAEELRKQGNGVCKNPGAGEGANPGGAAAAKGSKPGEQGGADSNIEPDRRSASGKQGSEVGDGAGSKGSPSPGGRGAGSADKTPRSSDNPDQSGSQSTDRVDVRRAPSPEDRKESERIAAEWFNPDGTVKRGAVSNEAAPDRVQDAVKAAERAIEEQRVPRSRQGVVSRFFRKLPDTKPAPGEAAPPAPPTPPATPPAESPPAPAEKPAETPAPKP